VLPAWVLPAWVLPLFVVVDDEVPSPVVVVDDVVPSAKCSLKFLAKTTDTKIISIIKTENVRNLLLFII
jgi:hypothetical protein